MWGKRRRTREPVPSDILVVCTGNICRSPFLAELLAQRHPGLTVASAGTGALVGEPPSGPTRELLAEQGIETRNVARQLVPELVMGARLVLTATAQHRTHAVELDPSAADRSFTMRELARLLGGPPSGPAGLEEMLAAGQAALLNDTFDSNDDLPDPFQMPMAAYRDMAATVEEALAVIDTWLSA